MTVTPAPTPLFEQWPCLCLLSFYKWSLCLCFTLFSDWSAHSHCSLGFLHAWSFWNFVENPPSWSPPCHLPEDKNELVPPSILDGGLACVSCQYQDNKHILVPHCSFICPGNTRRLSRASTISLFSGMMMRNPTLPFMSQHTQKKCCEEQHLWQLAKQIAGKRSVVCSECVDSPKCNRFSKHLTHLMSIW